MPKHLEASFDEETGAAIAHGTWQRRVPSVGTLLLFGVVLCVNVLITIELFKIKSRRAGSRLVAQSPCSSDSAALPGLRSQAPFRGVNKKWTFTKLRTTCSRRPGEIRLGQFLPPPEQAHDDEEISMGKKRTPELRHPCILRSRRRGLETESKDTRNQPPPYRRDYEQTFTPSQHPYPRGSDCFSLQPRVSC